VWTHDGLLAYVTDRSGQDEIWLRDREARRVDRPVITQRNFSEGDQTILLGAPTLSPDGLRIAFLRNGKQPLSPLRIWYSPVSGGTASPLVPIGQLTFQSAPSWSPDGQWIAFAEWDDPHWRLVKVRVGSQERVELRKDGIPNATPHWSPKDDWITWETTQGLMLVSPDGTRQQQLPPAQWHAHTWSGNAAEILGIRESDDRRLSLVALELRPNGRTRVLADLGASPPVNIPVRGLSLSPDGQAVVTSLLRQRGDLWLLKGLQPQERPFWSRLFRQSP
jgi:dipeptidyl aminopeptidase/acylaminoacyl peptidase